jgi:8-oxo-dGTP diphosphatase
MINQQLEETFRWLRENTLQGLSIDCVIFGYHHPELRVLCLRLIGSNGWCVPGGFVPHDLSIDEAAQQVLHSRTGLEKIFLKQFHTFGEVNRANLRQLMAESYPQLPPDYFPTRTISIGYYALVEYYRVAKPVSDFLTEEIDWLDVNNLPEQMLFDHRYIIEMGLKQLRAQLDHLPVAYHLMPETFTMPELQKLHEAILGQELDRANFQKRMLSYSILERLAKRHDGGAHKSPYLYRFIPEKYEAFLRNEF